MLSLVELTSVVLAGVIGLSVVAFAVGYYIIDQVTNGCDSAMTLVPQIYENLTDKVILVTGATSGIGKEIVRALSQTKCTIILAIGNEEKAQNFVKELRTAQVSGDNNNNNNHSNDVTTAVNECNLIVAKLDLDDLNQIKNEFIPNLKIKHNINQINVLICNGGIYPKKEKQSTKNKDYEIAFGVNYLSHMYLSLLLKPFLDNAANNIKDINNDTNNNSLSTNFIKSRIIVVSSITHDKMNDKLLPNIENDINSNDWKRTYDTKMSNVFSKGDAYAWSKLCNIWFVKQFNKLYGIEGNIIGVTLHPGTGPTGISVTNMIPKFLYPWFDSCEQLAFTPTWLASANEYEIKAGEYYRGTKYISDLKSFVNNEKYHSKLWQLGQQLIDDIVATKSEKRHPAIMS